MRIMTTGQATSTARSFTRAEFDEAYDEVVLGNHFFEEPAYYQWYRGRYRRTLEILTGLPLPRPARILEIGGGQMILLCHRMFGDSGVLADVSEEYADAVTRFGLGHQICDLLHDDLPARGEYDLVVMCEVFEHMPVPPHIVLRKIRAWLKPGGLLLLTTPNLYRFRNVVRLALGMPLFCNFHYPPRGKSIGHPVEYAAEQVRWQIEQAGLDPLFVEHAQLSNMGSTFLTRTARLLMRPLLVRARWRDSLVACGRRPETDDGAGESHAPLPGPVVEAGVMSG